MKGLQERIGKAYYVKDFEIFQHKYPFLCISSQTSDRNIRISKSRFPSEIKEGLLYLGNMMNVIDKDQVQLELLGIKTIIYLSPGKFEHLEEKFNCVHIQVNEKEHPDIDFDQISELILAEFTKKEKTPILIFCLTGFISAAICTKVMLEKNRAWSKEIAMAYVLNKRYEVKDIPSWLYQ